MTHTAYSFVLFQLEVASIQCARDGVYFNMGVGETDIMVQLSCSAINIQIVLHVQSAFQYNCSLPCCGSTQLSRVQRHSGELVSQIDEVPSTFKYLTANEKWT
jgi:hypothetical protein